MHTKPVKTVTGLSISLPCLSITCSAPSAAADVPLSLIASIGEGHATLGCRWVVVRVDSADDVHL